jgi:glucose/arabinose dehydrogenase
MISKVITKQLFTILLIISITGCLPDSEESIDDPFTPPDDTGESIVEAFPDLSFNRPVDLQHAGDGTDRIFVVEQRGVISVFDNDPDVTEKETFLDIESRVDDSSNEMGLLGLAFHPDFESNGYFYVNYTTSGNTVISRFQVSESDVNQADSESEQEILTFEQTQNNHNGGQIAFGPDGYLYIASGDGGGSGDPDNNAQDPTNLLGAILRIDIDVQENGNQYGIPSDNPFVNNQDGYREEIYAWGLRNPWRFSFDFETGRLWAGDVGQSDWEVIHIVENGLNYGWNIIEGSHCYPPGSNCDTDGLEMPVYEYRWGENNTGRSITGGYVYHGQNLPGLNGHFIYGDFISGRIWALEHSDLENPVNSELAHADFQISSFGVDQHGELYICGFDGKIHRLGSGVMD